MKSEPQINTRPAEVESVCYTVSQVRKKLNLGKSAVYKALEKGEIPNTRIGGRYIISRQAFDQKFGV